MSQPYLVLARKYRPQRFADIIGQEHVVRTLENAIRLGRVHHAFLFTGARGVGKTTTARVLARALNCEKGPTPDPCGTCAACQDILSGASTDVFEIDGASNTGVDNVRELRENVRYLPQRGRIKLYIIDEVHMLSTAAFNALLKTLEEPPPHVKFIFATTEPHKIPVTILSRCQRFDFRRVSAQKLGDNLRHILTQEKLSLAPEAVAAIVREAQGSVRDSLSLLDQVLSFAGGQAELSDVVAALGVVDRQSIFALCDAILARDAKALLSLVAELDGRGHDLGAVAALLVEHLRDLMVVQLVDGASETLLDRSPAELGELKAESAKIGRAELHRAFAIAVQVAEDVGRSPFARVSLEMGLLRLFEIEPSQSLQNLLSRLDHAVGGANAVSAKAPLRSEPAARPGSRDAAPDSSGPRPASRDGRGDDSARSGVATPTAAPGAAPGPGFKAFVERVRANRPAMASVLEHAHVRTFEAEGVELDFVAGTFYAEQARDADNKSLLERLLVEHFGRAVRLSLHTVEAVAEAGSGTLAESREEARRAREEKVKNGALSHPAVRDALHILGGEVKEVIPLAMDEEPSI